MVLLWLQKRKHTHTHIYIHRHIYIYRKNNKARNNTDFSVAVFVCSNTEQQKTLLEYDRVNLY